MQDFRLPPNPEQPILRLGLAGFSPDQCAAIERSLHGNTGRWRICQFAEADAWMVNGAKVKVDSGGFMRVLPGRPTEQSVRLDPGDVSHPIAFSTPVASADVEPLWTFAADSLASVHATLLQFENFLRRVRTLFVLGGDIVRLGPQLRHGVFHVSNRGSLLAVLDFRSGAAGVAAHAHPADFADAQWDKRPASAADIPRTFIRTSPAELAWTYAWRSEKDLLPPRYKHQTVYFRHAPKVPPRWVSDSQLMILRELAAEPCTMPALLQRTGLGPHQVNEGLRCLYFAGAVTTTPSKAARKTPRLDSDGMHSRDTGMEQFDSRNSGPLYKPDPTVPASFHSVQMAHANT